MGRVANIKELLQPHILVSSPPLVYNMFSSVKAETQWVRLQAARQRAERQQAAWDNWFDRQKTLQARLKEQARMLGLGEWFVEELQWIQREMNRTWKYDQWEATETRQQTRPKPRRPG